MPRTGDGKSTIRATGYDFNECMIQQISWPTCMSRFGVVVRKISCSWRCPTLWSCAWCRVVVVRIKSRCHKPSIWSTANYSSTMIFIFIKFYACVFGPKCFTRTNRSWSVTNREGKIFPEIDCYDAWKLWNFFFFFLRWTRGTWVFLPWFGPCTWGHDISCRT